MRRCSCANVSFRFNPALIRLRRSAGWHAWRPRSPRFESTRRSGGGVHHPTALDPHTPPTLSFVALAIPSVCHHKATYGVFWLHRVTLGFRGHSASHRRFSEYASRLMIPSTASAGSVLRTTSTSWDGWKHLSWLMYYDIHIGHLATVAEYALETVV
jgi:hypothetical protein